MINMVKKGLWAGMAKVSMPIGNRGVNSSKGVVQHVPLKNEGDGSIMARKRLIKDHLHDQRTYFRDLLGSKTGNHR